MNIDINELFVVERGFKLNNRNMFSFLGGPSEAETEPHFDRSYNGMVFRAIEVCGSHIACECMYGGGYHKEDVGKPYSFNATELELMTVTEGYLTALQPASEGSPE